MLCIPVLPLENKTNHYVSEGHLTWGNWWGRVGTPEIDPSVTKSALHVCFHCNLCPFFCFTIINSVRQADSFWDCIRFSIASNPFLQKSGPIYADLLPSLISSFTSVPHRAKEERNQAKIMEIFSCSGFPLYRLNSEPHYLQARKLKSILSINMSWASTKTWAFKKKLVLTYGRKEYYPVHHSATCSTTEVCPGCYYSWKEQERRTLGLPREDSRSQQFTQLFTGCWAMKELAL